MGGRGGGGGVGGCQDLVDGFCGSGLRPLACPHTFLLFILLFEMEGSGTRWSWLVCQHDTAELSEKRNL